MARFRKPFFRAPRGLWYVQLDGKQINLGPDKDEAFKTYHGLMQQRAENPTPVEVPPDPRLVVVIVDEFLEWCEKHRASDTYRWYLDRLNSFCKTIEPDLAAVDLRPHHVQKWVDNYPVAIKSGSRRNLIAAIKRAMKWAEEQGYIELSPIRHMRKPGCGRKEQIVTREQYEMLLARYKDQEFKDLLTISWETGCRPQESLRVEARHVDIAGSRWVFPTSESKGRRIPRVVYLTPKALEITKRLMEKYPTGALFRNTDGLPWTPYATNCRFQHVRRKTGIKFSLYQFRHGLATRALLGGMDAITVATLLGHSDTSTLSRVYSHVSQNPVFMQEQIRKAAG